MHAYYVTTEHCVISMTALSDCSGSQVRERGEAEGGREGGQRELERQEK